MAKSVIAIFDIGKTNKKFFLFDEALNEVAQEYRMIPEDVDDDGFPCDDLAGLTAWIKESVRKICSSPHYVLKGLNFSTYGATLVHLGETGGPVTPLYNYLKPYPEEVMNDFFATYPEDINNLETASPKLGMLNSGLQLYWLKKSKPALFNKIRHTLHFPQYLSYLFTGKMVSEPTSLGCHTRLWDFTKNDYHYWIKQEGLMHLFPEIVPTTHSFEASIHDHIVTVGVGIHDSSSALASYMMRTKEPFILISTGTWSITLNPFTSEALTREQLQRDCLHYLNIYNKPVKASRLFLGHEFDYQVKRLSEVFHKETDYYKRVTLTNDFIRDVDNNTIENSFYPHTIENPLLVNDVFKKNEWRPELFSTYEEAYHHIIRGLVQLQVASLKLAKGESSIKYIYVDGGFTSNNVFIQLLKYSLPGYSVEVSDFPLGSSYGAAGMLKKN